MSGLWLGGGLVSICCEIFCWITSLFRLSITFSFCNYQVAFHPKKHRWPGRLITAKGTALGIPLTGIIFPRSPDHNKQPSFGRKKTALGTGSGFTRLLELSSSVKSSIIMFDASCQVAVVLSGLNNRIAWHTKSPGWINMRVRVIIGSSERDINTKSGHPSLQECVYASINSIFSNHQTQKYRLSSAF